MDSQTGINANDVCRRTGERRQARLKSIIYGFRQARRAGDRRNELCATPSYVDIHNAGMYTLVLCIMALCVADVYFTLMLIDHGSRELNPLLNWALQRDPMLFYSLKYVMTAVCVFWLLQHKQFRFFRLRGYHVLAGVLGVYILLISYQLSMLVHIV